MPCHPNRNPTPMSIALSSSRNSRSALPGTTELQEGVAGTP